MTPARANQIEACERSIILAADNVSKLRKPDVMRVMEDFFFGRGSTQEMVDYISESRPDLAQEAKECQLELIPVETRFAVTLGDFGIEGYDQTTGQ